MAKRKPISIINSLGRVNSLPSIVDNRLVSTDSILSAANKLRDRYSNDAYNNYNANLFPEIKTNIEPIQFEQPTIEVQEKPLSYNKSKKTSSSYKGSKNDFINNIYNSYYKAVKPGAASDADADRQARFLTQKAVFETGTGSHIVNTHNYGGHRINGKWLAFDSMDDFTKRDVALLDKKWSNWRNSKSDVDFVNAITTNTGRGYYAPRHEYQGYMNLTDKVNNTINMGRRKLRCGGKTSRPKAWIGAVVSAAGSILGSVLSSDAQRRQQEELRRQQEHQAAIERAEGLTESLGLMQSAQKEYENRFRVNYANGGRRRLRQGVQITDGGYAIPIGQNTFLLRGGSHEDVNETGQTGIGLNVGGKEIEVEGGEVIQKTPTELRVFSKQPIINGVSPADAIKAGANKDEIFSIQQSLNGNYNGDRTREAIKKIGRKNYLRGYNIIDYMKNGGYITRPVGRINARLGIRELLRRGYNTVRDSFVGDIWRLANQDVINTDGSTATFIGNDGKVHTVTLPGVQGGAPNVLPGRVGGFRPQNIERGVRTTRNIANAVRQSVRRATPVNASKAATRVSKTINAPKGDVVNHAKQQVKGYSWLRSEPIQQGYQGAVAGRGTMMGDPYAGQLNIGLSVGDRLRSVVNNAPVVPLGIGLGAGVAGGLHSAINNNDNGNGEYVYGQARGNNAAPYDAIQIGASAPTLNRTNVSIPSIDNYYNETIDGGQPTEEIIVTGKQPNTSNTSTVTERTTRNNRRTLSSRGTKPSTVAINNNSTLSTPSATFAPDYTEQQMLDYINGNRTVADNTNNNTYTNPNEAILREMASKDSNYNGTNTNVSDTTTELGDVTGNTNKWGTIFKGSDWIGLGADLIGSLGSALINYNAADNIADPAAPVRVSPGKLITNWNIAPRLSEVNMLRNRMLRDSDEAVSSAARLNRRNSINMFTNNQADKLWGEKTNREVELLNQDALNQQQVNAQNVAAYNDYLNRLYDARTRRGLMRSQALQVGLSGLSDAVGNFLDQGKQRYSDQQAMRYYTALLPENGRQWLRRNGVDFLRRGGRIK